MPGKINIEDLLMDESFINYCKGASQKDIAKWKLLIQQNPDSRKEIEAARKKFYEIFTALAINDQNEQEAAMKKKLSLSSSSTPIVNLYEGKETEGRIKTKNIFSLLIKLTAAAMIILTASYLAVNLIHTKKQMVTSFISTNGERKTFQLPDGSVVKLNSGSKIIINEQYGITTRDIYLEGEAFFDVKHNNHVPFIVHTETMDVKALGTAFNVKAYPGERITEASLLRGSVEVTLKKEAGRKVILHPNEKVSCFQVDKKEVISPKPSEKTTQSNEIKNDHLVQTLSKNPLGDIKEIAWTENKLEFTDETFVQIAQRMERWYGVKIEFKDNGLRQYRFTGIFEKEKIETALSILKESRNFNYKIIHGDTMTIQLYQ